MKKIWGRIEKWLTEHAPTVLRSLAPGATEEHLRVIEAELGRSLPEDVALSYRIHDGQYEGWDVSERFIYGDQLYSLTKMLSCWKALGELADEPPGSVPVIPVGPVHPVKDTRSRVPVAGDDSTHYYFLDFDPAPGGDVGQIVLSFHDELQITCVAPSFRAWLEHFAHQLEVGRYVYCARRDGLIPREWADE